MLGAVTVLPSSGTVWPSRVIASWALAYASVHAWWAVTGAPHFDGLGESFFPEGWVPVVPSVLSAVVTLLIGSGVHRDRDTRMRWLLTGLGWLSATGMLLYSFMFPLNLLMAVGVLFGTKTDAVDWTALLAQGSGVVVGVLTIMATVAEQRRARHACPQCGRRHSRSPERRLDPSPWWVYLAGYATVIACLSRIGAELLHGALQSKSPDVSWTFLGTFVILMVLGGTLLPLALVHRWGRIWPRWVLPLAGRNVPRWIVLGPALFMGVGLTTYFGIGGMTAWITGSNVDGPAWFLWVVLPAYTMWGLGLLVAASSYFNLTRPECPTRAPTGRLDELGGYPTSA
jgi:hypothetical protein